ncbi:MAG TPA: phytanoyl-CoA dioxygenase family protein [Acidimicrobiales bacterium]
MSIDQRTRRYDGIRDLSLEEIVDSVIPTAVAAHGDLAARGARFLELPPLGFGVGDAGFTLAAGDEGMRVAAGVGGGTIVAELDEPALSRLLQDEQTAMGLAMTSDVRLTRGRLDDWIAWEPVLRALLDGRPVHEPGAIQLVDGDGGPLDLDRAFTLEDDPEELRQFLTEAGFVHLRGVFTPDEMAVISADLDRALETAQPDDGASWWATDADGRERPVRILWFEEHSDALAALLADPRLTWLAALTGDGHQPPTSAEGLVKPLDIVRGLSDLPWHKDCGQGHHSYVCNGLTVGISVTGADRDSGALGVIPGSHRANTLSATRDRRLDLAPRKLETETGDITVHCSDTLHRAHPPTKAPRKVVYTSLRLAPLPGDRLPAGMPNSATRRDRAGLTSVEDRIEAADGGQTRLGG